MLDSPPLNVPVSTPDNNFGRVADILAIPALTIGTIPDAGLEDYVVLPSVECALSPAPLRHTACHALLRLEDSTIWHLRTRGAPWSPQRLIVATRTLQNEHTGRQDSGYLTGRLSYELEISSVTVLPPILERVDPGLWEFRRTAVAMVMRWLRGYGSNVDPADLAAITGAVEENLHAMLQAALDDFRAATDAEALGAATAASGNGDIGLYNFLVEAPHRAWRLQLARTFPIFVRAAAVGTKGSAGETVRTAVDSGRPLVRCLAQRWSVSAGAIRSLLGRDVALVGARWEADIRGLVKLLDALRPEDRPKTDAADWAHFNRAATGAERIFRCPPWTSVLALTWLREAARHRWADLDEGAAQAIWGPAAIACVQDFRDGLVRLLELESARQPEASRTTPGMAFDSVADHYLSTRQPRRLVALAESFAWNLQDLRADLQQESSFLQGEAFWPLLPGELQSTDGTRTVRPLTSGAALREYGAAMNNCLEDVMLASYVADCAEAKCFILGVVDSDSGQPVSTAEIRLRRLVREGRLDPNVVQHAGHSNDDPSSDCERAIAEALAVVRSETGQRHLQMGLLRVRQRRLMGKTRARDEAERLQLAEALSQTLGAKVLAELTAGAMPRGGRQ
jgi:hypothetical protein